jgi:hypothetical protein
MTPASPPECSTEGARPAAAWRRARSTAGPSTWAPATSPPATRASPPWSTAGLERGLARRWTDGFHVADRSGLGEVKPGPLRYGAPRGLRSLVLDLLDGLDVTGGVAVGAVGPGPTVDGEAYDAVVLAMPDPQAERLLDPALADERAAVAERVWEPVLSVARASPRATGTRARRVLRGRRGSARQRRARLGRRRRSAARGRRPGAGRAHHLAVRRAAAGRP